MELASFSYGILKWPRHFFFFSIPNFFVILEPNEMGGKVKGGYNLLAHEEFNNMLNSRAFPNLLDHYNSVLQTSNLRHSTGKRITGSLGAGRTGLLLSSLPDSEIPRKNFLKRNVVFHCCNFRWYAFQLVCISCLGLS